MWDWGSAYLHILGAILFVGYALFWSIMAFALARRVDGARRQEYLSMIKATRWPPGGVPQRLRIPFLGLGWLFLLLMLASGLALLSPSEFTVDAIASSFAGQGRLGQLFSAKMILVGLICVGQLVLSLRLAGSIMYAMLAGALCVTGLSAVL
jgi:hypothetical protein